jgi:chemotaxis protein CheX
MSMVAIDVQDLSSIISDVWNTYIDTEVMVLPFASERASTGDQVTARIQIHTEQNVTVLVGCDGPSAADLARRMFRLDDAAELDIDDVGDALGEVVNVVGGNVKSLTKSPSSLSLPHIVAGRLDPELLGAAVCWVDVMWKGGQANLAVWINEGVPSTSRGEGVS